MRQDNPRILITGINGFAGSHLAERLVAGPGEVFGLAVTRDLRNLEPVDPRPTLFHGDIRDFGFVKKTVSEIRPDQIYHLAGSAYVPDAEADPRPVYEVNVLGTLNLLEAVRTEHPAARVLVVTSAEVYGRVPDEELPVREDRPLQPVTPYGVTKAAADLAAYQYAAAYGLHVVRVRPFNHIGPRQSDRFVCSSIVRQIVEIERGERESVLSLGNLASRRDFTDVRDMVGAYRIVLEKSAGGEVYNIGSDQAWTVEEIAGMSIQESRVSGIIIQQKDGRIRKNDIQSMLCDSAKLRNELGWRPEIPIRRTLGDMLGYWRVELGSTALRPMQRGVS